MNVKGFQGQRSKLNFLCIHTCVNTERKHIHFNRVAFSLICFFLIVRIMEVRVTYKTALMV